LKHGYNYFKVADIGIPVVALGQFFGRLGCFASGCCWGTQVDASHTMGVQFPAGSLAYNAIRGEGGIAADALHTFHVHPVQVYESVGALAIFFILTYLRGRKRFNGQILLAYMFLYPVLRSGLETIRGDKVRGVYDLFGAQISTSQIISGLIAAAAIVLLIVLGRDSAAKNRALPSAGVETS
jgi:phosphatidylglycerol:prolipoprotein diacylglycerol transferase